MKSLQNDKRWSKLSALNRWTKNTWKVYMYIYLVVNFAVSWLSKTYFWYLSTAGTWLSVLTGFFLFCDFCCFLADLGLAPLLLLGKVKRSFRWSGRVNLLYTTPAENTNWNTLSFIFLYTYDIYYMYYIFWVAAWPYINLNYIKKKKQQKTKNS
jgi:hypothetical protein